MAELIGDQVVAEPAESSQEAAADTAPQASEAPASPAPAEPATAQRKQEAKVGGGALAPELRRMQNVNVGGNHWCILIVSIGIVAGLILIGVAGHMLNIWVDLGLVSGKYEISSAAWDDETAGKTVFIKFYAPWCGHCKRMKPDWDKLMEDYKDSSVAKVAEVDCTGSGKSLCEKVGVRGFPTLKYGDPGDLQDYKGGRSFRELSEFASTLGPICGPDHLDLCKEEQRAKILEYQSMTVADREDAIKEKEALIEKLEADFKLIVSDIQTRYQEASARKDDAVKSVKDSGLGILKSIAAFMAKNAQEGRGADL